MVRHPLRPTLLILLAAWLTIIAFAAHLLLSAQISRWEGHFDEDVQLMAGEVKQKLDTNEAVLAGFSAFLHAVPQRYRLDDALRRLCRICLPAYLHDRSGSQGRFVRAKWA
jgi:hypothetical protein